MKIYGFLILMIYLSFTVPPVPEILTLTVDESDNDSVVFHMTWKVLKVSRLINSKICVTLSHSASTVMLMPCVCQE